MNIKLNVLIVMLLISGSSFGMNRKKQETPPKILKMSQKCQKMFTDIEADKPTANCAWCSIFCRNYVEIQLDMFFCGLGALEKTAQLAKELREKNTPH